MKNPTQLVSRSVFRRIALGSLAACGGAVASDVDNTINLHPDTEAGFTARFGYAVFLPQGHSTSTRTYPLIVAMGGTGERGNGDSELGRILKNGPLQKIGQSTTSRNWFGITSPCIVLQWQIPGTAVFNTGDTEEMISYAMAKYKVDPASIHVTGLSLGGGHAWKFAAAEPERVASLMPVCGASGPSAAEGAKLKMPVWAHHNAGDGLVVMVNTSFPWCRDVATGVGGTLPKSPIDTFPYAPAAYSGQPNYTGHFAATTGWTWTVGKSAVFGSDRPLMTVYSVGGHGGWSEAYHTGATTLSLFTNYEWMLAQKRADLGLVTDNRSLPFITKVGPWTNTSVLAGAFGADHSRVGAGNAGASFTFTTRLPTAGTYAVDMRWPTAYCPSVPVSVAHAGGTASVNTNQTLNGNTWNTLGTWSFPAGPAAVTIHADKLSQIVVADAVRYRLLSSDGANSAPTISTIAAQTLTEDATTAALAFTIGDAQTAAESLTIAKSCSNVSLVPSGNIVLGGSGANRTVTITPTANQSGTATIALTVTDGDGATASTSFTVTVNAVNDQPTITPIAQQMFNKNTTTAPRSFTVGDVETAAGSLAVSALSSNPSLMPISGIVFGGSGSNRWLTLTPTKDQIGTATITVTVKDAGGLTASTAFVVTVKDGLTTANTAPTITTVVNQMFSEDGRTAPRNFTIADLETPVASLVMSALSSNPTLVPIANIVFSGSGANRSAVIAPAADQNGTTTITLIVTDGGGLTASTAFLVTVKAVNDPPTITAIADQILDTDTASGALAFTIGDSETAAGSLVVTTASSDQAVVPDAGIVLGGSGADRTVTVTPTPGAAGTVTITLSVGDGALITPSLFSLTVGTPTPIAN